MSSVIIDGKNADGARCSASVPDFIWQLYVATCVDEKQARVIARHRLTKMKANYSRNLQMILVHDIAKPALLKRVQNVPECQLDIEDFA